MTDLLLRMNDLRKDLLAYLEAGVNHLQRREELKSKLHTSYDFLRHVEHLERSLAAARAEREIADQCVASVERRLAEAQRERDELAAQLAALREAAARYVHSLGWDEEVHPTLGRVSVSRDDEEAEDVLARAITDTAPAVEAYTRRVQAEALESAYEEYECDEDHDATGAQCPKAWLRARAAKIRGGR